MKKLLFLVLSALVYTLGFSREYPLNDNWSFTLSDNQDYSQVSYKINSDWKTLSLPHDWAFEHGYDEHNAQEAKGGYAIGGIGWYRKTFSLDKEQIKGNCFDIYFEAVYMNSEVWVNGHYLGKRPYGYISFQYDITKYVKAGPNVISVRVDNSKAKSARWYHGCGIYGQVKLIERNPTHFVSNSISVTTPEINSNRTTIAVKWEINKKSNCDVVIELKSKEGQTLVEKTVGHNANYTRLELENPQIWDINSPNLYTMVLHLCENGNSIDTQSVRFGVRSVSWDVNKGFYLNNRKLKIRGVCEHLEGGPVGAAWTENMLRWKIESLKAMGCNAIRTAHNPQLPVFYDLCDELGVLVLDEVFDGWRQKADNDYGAVAFKEWWEKDLTSFIRRDRNHPSIFAWSVGNETNGEKWVSPKLVAICHKLDSTRLVTSSVSDLEFMDIVGGNGTSEHKTFMDNYKPTDKPFLATEHPHNGWCRGVYRSLTTYRDGYPSSRNDPYETPNYTKNEIFNYSRVHPDSINSNAYFKSSYDNWLGSITVSQYLANLRDKPWFSGSFRWTGFDYYGEVRPGAWPIRGSQSGVLDFAGFRKDAFYLYQSEWTSAPMVHILPSWTHPYMKEGTKVPVVVYTTGEEVELFYNDKSLGKKKKGLKWDELYLKWLVPYKPGKLTAVAYTNGQKIASTEVRTSKEPSSLELVKENSYLTGSSKDLNIITIKEIDDNGTFYPYGENRVYYSLEGDAEIFSAESGAYDDDELNFHAKSRRNFFGLGRVFIRNHQPEKPVKFIAAAILGDKKLKISSNIHIDIKEVIIGGKGEYALSKGEYTIYYTTNGDRPTKRSKKYNGPFTIKPETIVKAIVYSKGEKLFEMSEKFGANEGIYWGKPYVRNTFSNQIQAENAKLHNFKIVPLKLVDSRKFYVHTPSSKEKVIIPTSKEASLEFYYENAAGDSPNTKIGISMYFETREPIEIEIINNNKVIEKKTIKVSNYLYQHWRDVSFPMPLISGANRIKVNIKSEKNIKINWYKIYD